MGKTGKSSASMWKTRKSFIQQISFSFLQAPDMLPGIQEYILVFRSCPTLCDPMDCSPPGSSVHGDSPGKNTGVGCHALPQGIFPTQGKYR